MSHLQEPYLYAVDQVMSEAGINLQVLQTECSEGQIEFVMQPQYGITTPDNVFILRQAVSDNNVYECNYYLFSLK